MTQMWINDQHSLLTHLLLRMMTVALHHIKCSIHLDLVLNVTLHIIMAFWQIRLIALEYGANIVKLSAYTNAAAIQLQNGNNLTQLFLVQWEAHQDW